MVQTIETCEDLVAQIDDLGVEATVRAHRKPPLLTRILRDLYDLYHDQDVYLSFLAHYPLIPSDLAEQIASTLDPSKVDIAIGLAGNPRCPQQSLQRLTKHSEVAVRHALAANPNLTPKEFQALVEDENEFVRATLAQNSALPNPLQFILADDRSSAVRIALSDRKNLDTDVAIHLANSDDTLVSAATILSYTLDEEVLQLWADQNKQHQQLLLLKRSQALPAAVHAALRVSPHSFVCRTALKESELSGPEMLYLLESEDTRDRIFLAEQPHLPASIQRLLAQDASPRVRRRLAGNRAIHESIALHIAASNDLNAIRTLTKNPATSDATLRELCQHPDDDIALLVAYRDDLAEEHYDLLINHRESLTVAEHLAYQEIGFSKLSEVVAQQLAKHPAPSIRAFAARAAKLNDSIRSLLIKDPSPQVRLKLASNPSLSEGQLRALQQDPDRKVVFAAEENFAQRIRQQQREQAQADTHESGARYQRSSQVERPRKGALFNKIANFFND
ncbi:hypothetical protein QEH59_08120 [Coraliomargarita sp. SDUM461004]|uniref:DUF2336 domain-containing protein n=1 Tax=Thalassobacterium sedimentorum TaxID=3041258 RepID=A0ABU1AJP9_9BACT|nr:hypothetical protein [Coraliomargarita sp. SDUM461004]MDQ8194388.1 hypothetical protein [Coraliomargarita sp. SDUM461004]